MAGQQIDIVANLLMKVDGAEAGISKLKNKLSQLKMPNDLENSFKKSFSNLDTIFARYKSQVEKGFNTKGDVTGLAKTGKELDAELNRLSKHFTELTGKEVNFKVKSDEIINAEKQLEKLIEKRDSLTNNALSLKIEGGANGAQEIQTLLNELEKVQKGSKTSEYASNAINFLKTGDIENAVVQLNKAEAACKRFNDAKKATFVQNTGFTMTDAIAKIKTELTSAEGAFGQVNTEVAQFKEILANLQTGQVEKATELANQLFGEYLNGEGAIRQATGAMQDFAQSSFSMTQQLQQLQQSTQYFFGLRNMINLLKRGVREAIGIIKELDAAMTETAVVTTHSVGDMWKMLPEYTANANALGATVLDMYKSTTLYYQQGLNAEQAMSIATETMKMARIAGLEAADATDMMTAALRGFNMEINETSAQRINDVYSNLAAKTASNTEELGKAMQRTASIAASAGMSFEGTAAFLAQAIETTREPAENIGTAMKTIVARFTEMKKDPLGIAEVEGEEVSYNKVDAALQSIGVSLKDANGQFRALDEVFLDISQKWDSLSQTQQRYVATIAAGSRQQSRFIAMMSNYGRTVELMDYANNSAGASNEQFGKTLDSLQAKINKFQNAWKEFLMGIMNDSFAKTIVGAGTKILNIVNKLIDVLSFGGKAKGIKSFLSVFTAFTGLKLAGRGINALIGGLGGMLDPRAGGFKAGFKTGAMGQKNNQINTATNRIVNAIQGLIPHIDSKTGANMLGLSNKNGGFGDYGKAREQIYDMLGPNSSAWKTTGTYKLDDLLYTIDSNKLNQAQEKLLFQSMPGLKKSITKNLQSVLSESLFAAGKDPKMANALAKGFNKGQISLQTALEKGGAFTTVSVQDKINHLYNTRGQQASIDFEKEIIRELNNEGFFKNLRAQGESQGLSGGELGHFIATGYKDEISKRKTLQLNPKLLEQQFELSPAEKAAQAFSKVGGAISSAGMSLQMWGAQLSQTNPILGEIITKLGSLTMTLGTIPNLISSIIAGGPAIWALSIAIAAIGTFYTITQRRAKNTQKAAEKVAESYKTINKETQENIATLKQYYAQAERWSQGVDKFGNNVNLSDEEYTQYLDAVEKIAEINPDIVEGYNAQGRAIININKALAETIDLEKKRQEEAQEEYLSPLSIDKLLQARNINDAYQKATLQQDWGKSLKNTNIFSLVSGFSPLAPLAALFGKSIDTKFDTSIYTEQVAPFTEDISSIVEQATQELGKSLTPENIDQHTDTAQYYQQAEQQVVDVLKKFNIDYQDLLSGDQLALNRFMQNESAIYKQISALYGSDGMPESVTKLFDGLDEASEAFNEATAEVTSWLQTYVSNLDSFKDIPDEFKSYIMQGLEDIAINPEFDTGEELKEEARKLVKSFDNLTEAGGQYAKIMEGVTAAQDEYAKTLDDTAYLQEVQDELEELRKLRDKYAEYNTASGDAMVEYLENQIAKIEKFTEDSGVSLVSALNEAYGYIKSAEEAYTSFQEATKSDLDTGVKSMKSIYDAAWEEDHAQGGGDNTFWEAAKYLLGENELKRIEELGGDIDDVRAAMKALGPELQEGQAGFAAFWQEFQNTNLEGISGITRDADGALQIDVNENPQVYEEIAARMGRSVEYVMAQFNAGRQWMPIDFINDKQVRKALATDTSVIKGTLDNAQGQKNLYVTEDYIRQALGEAGYTNYFDQSELIERMQNEGTLQLIPGPDMVTKDTFKDWGVDDLDSLIHTLNETGEFDRSQVEEYARAWAEQNGEEFDADAFVDSYQRDVEAREDPTVEPIHSIADTTSQIRDLMYDLLHAQGVVSKDEVTETEELLKQIQGGEGTDQPGEYFAEGTDSNGRALTPEQFQKDRAALVEQARAATEQAQEYRRTAEKARENGDTESVKNAEQAAENLEKMAELTWSYIKSGDETWAQKYTEGQYNDVLNQKISEGASVSEAQQAADDAYDTAFETAQGIVAEGTKGFQDGMERNQYYNAPAYKPSGSSSLKPSTTSTSEPTERPQGGIHTDSNIPIREVPPSVKNFFDGFGKVKPSSEIQGFIDDIGGIKVSPSLTGFIKKITNGTINTNGSGSNKPTSSGPKVGGTSGPAPKVSSGKGASITPTITPKVDTSGVTSTLNKAASKKTEMPVKIKDETQPGIQAIRRKITQNPVYMPVRTKGGGIGGNSGASGINNTIPYRSVPQAGSLASGNKKGRLGPNNRGGMTLTGELGYEVAWLPSEGRSVILGADGPQMVNLPSSAVVYDHKQSEKIMRRKSNPIAGSLGYIGNYYYKEGRGGGGGTTKAKNKGSSKSKTSKKQKNINNFSIEEVIRFDIDQTLEWLNSELNRREKDIEVALEKIGNVYDNITDDVNAQLAALKEIAQNNQDLADSYQRQLKAIDEGTYKEVISWTNNAGKSQEAIYDLSKYIYRDDDGVYKVDTDQIKKLTSNAEREAVFKAANGLISSLQSGLIKAQEAADDARQQMEELGRKVSETFYQWENELTEIYDLTQRIEDETSFTDRFMSQVELELSKLNTGFGETAKSIENIRKVLLRNNDNIQRQIEDQQQMIAARQRELNRMLSSADEQERVDRFQNATGIDEATKAANIAWAEDQKKIADTALKYVTNIYRDIDGSVRYAIDWEGFNRDNVNSPFNEETYNAIKDYLDDLNDAATEFNDSIKEQTDFIKDTYKALADYQKTVVDMEETLIKGVEEEIKNETDNAKKLSDSIRDQLKDLLDEVKRRLDERRKQEDNLKTERDISQKQQRLAALRADTAGGHQVEIAQLEKEIAEAQQNYGRTLEDQLLDRLQQQADEAAKQRERQIELAEKSNEINASTNKELVDLWLKNPEAYKEEIRSAWLEAQGYDEKGEAGQWALEQEFESEFAKLVTAVEQSGFNNVEQIFSATAEDVSTLVNLVNQLVNGKIGRNDNLAKDFNAQEDATIHNVISWETISKDAEGARIARESGGSATDARAHDFTLEDLIAGGFTPSELKEANYTAAELWNAGIQNVPTLKDAGYNARDLKDAGATIQDILNSYGPEETRNAGFDVNDFDIAEINYELAKIAFTLDELANSDTRYAELAQLDLASLVPEVKPEEAPQPVAIPAVTYPYGKASATTGKIKSGSSGNQVKAIQWALRQMGYKGKNGKPLSIDGKFGANTVYAVKAFQKAMKITADGVVGNQTRAKFKAKGYATGGLADYTGPAWLDGTPSKPELVLNAADTKNFLALRDVLSSAMKSTGAVNNSYGGDVTYEVNINVDKLTSDYDVDKVANRVKQIIVKDSSYRNVTQARNFR